MTDIGKRLAGPATLTNAAATQYTCPADTTAIVRHMTFTNITASDHTVTVSIGADAAGTRILDQVPVSARGVLDWPCLHVLAAAEVLQAYADANSAVNICVTGIEES